MTSQHKRRTVMLDNGFKVQGDPQLVAKVLRVKRWVAEQSEEVWVDGKRCN